MKGRRRYWTLLLVVINLHSTTLAQAIEVQWVKHFGGSDWDHALNTLVMPDSSLITVGYTMSEDYDITDTTEGYEMLVTRQAMDGGFIWIQTYGGTEFDWANDVVKFDDSTFIVAATSRSADGVILSNNGGRDIVLMRMDLDGNILWQKNYGGSSDESGETIINDLDGGFVFCSRTSSTDGDVGYLHGSTESDYWVVKVDAAGNILWENSFGTYADDYPKAIIQLEDSSYIVSGNIIDDGGDVSEYYGSTDTWIIHISKAGELIWEKTFGGTNSDQAHGLLNWKNGRFLFCGYSESDDIDLPGNYGSEDGWLMMLDSIGSVLWSFNFGGSGTNGEGFFSICKIGVNGIGVVGCSGSLDFDVSEAFGALDAWMVVIDSSGNIVDEKSIGGDDSDIFYSVSQIDSTKLYLCGYSRSADAFMPDNYGNFDAVSALYTICYNQYYPDVDGDGFGNALLDSIDCSAPIGYVSDSTDCDDTNPDIHPAVKEICNTLDDNCNGIIDDGFIYTWQYADADGDTFGDMTADTLACPGIEGYVSDSTDCNDANPEIYPGAPEILNGADDDCDYLADEGLSTTDLASHTLNIYPVPATLYISIETGVQQNALLRIHNQAGALILEIADWNDIPINISNLPAGIYYIRIQSNSGVIYGQFVKE